MSRFTQVTQAAKVLFRYGEKSKLNLFEAFPGIKEFFKHRRNLAYFRTFGDIVFTGIIILGLFGPQDPLRNISLFIAWGIWWTTIVLSWFFVGKLWCAICPFPGLGRIFQRFGLALNLEFPQFFRKHALHFSLLFLVIILWTEAVTDMKNWPAGTAYLLMGIVAGATIMEVLFKGQAWCRVCPMGGMIGTAATISMIEFRPDLSKCKSCRTFSCVKGREGVQGCPVYLGAYNVRNSIGCLLCGRCVSLCEHDSPRVNLRNPFAELILNKGRFITCSRIIPFLMASQLARYMQDKAWYHSVVTPLFGSAMFAHTVVLGIALALVIGFIRLGNSLFAMTEDELFGRFSPITPVLLPLAFAGELAYRLDYFLSHLGDAFPTLGRQSGIDLTGLAFTVPAELIYPLCILLLCAGAFGGSYVIRVFYRDDFEGLIPRRNYLALQTLIATLLIIYLFLF